MLFYMATKPADSLCWTSINVLLSVMNVKGATKEIQI